MKKSRLFSLACLGAALSLIAGITLSNAYDPSGWMKKINKKRGGRKVTSTRTTVAAVRGVDEPSEVDPEARDFDGVKLMEARVTAPASVDNFRNDGSLKGGEIKAAPSSSPDAVGKTHADLMQNAPVSQQMRKAVKPISGEEEMQIGEEVAANIIAQFGLLKNDALTDYVNLVGLSVARYNPRQDVPYRFAVLDSNILNAFAAPGGYIFVTKGLLLSLKNEAELACVLGHEIGHISHKHVINEIQKSRIVDASIPSYVKSSAKNAQYLSQVTDLAISSLWKGLSRDDEFDADRAGIDYAAAAGYDAHAFMDVLEMLKNKEHTEAMLKEVKFLMSTHPKPEDRLRNAATKLNAMPASGQKLEQRYKSSAKI